MVDYNIIHGISYNWLVVAYFFLGGLAAGSFLIGFLFKYIAKVNEGLGKILSLLSPFILGLGMLLLLLDLGRPFGFYTLFFNFTATSAVSWGVFLMSVFMIVGFIQAWLLFKDNDSVAMIFGLLGLPLAIIGGSYTGVILAQMPGHPLWSLAFTPILFLIGGLTSAMALALLLSIFLDLKAEKVGNYLVKLVLIELAIIVIELIVIATGSEAAFLPTLLAGPLAFWFWGVEIILGALVPVYLLSNNKYAQQANWQAIAAALVLIGILAMRYIVVIGSQVLS